MRQQRVQVRGSWKRARKRCSQITALTNQTVMSLHSSSEDEEVKLMKHVPSFQSPLGTILFVLITWSRCCNLLLYAKFVTAVSCILWKIVVQNKVLGSNGTFVAPMSYVYHVRPVSSSQFRLSPIKYTMLTVHQLLVFELLGKNVLPRRNALVFWVLLRFTRGINTQR
jgi:hypothetical protein